MIYPRFNSFQGCTLPSSAQLSRLRKTVPDGAAAPL